VSLSLPSGSRRQAGPLPAATADGGSRSAGSPAFRHIRTAITSIKTAKEARSGCSGIWAPSQLPSGAVSMPAAANRRPVGTSTCPYRQRSTAPTTAVTATVNSEMPTAVAGSTPIQ